MYETSVKYPQWVERQRGPEINTQQREGNR